MIVVMMAVIPGCCLVLCIPPTNSTNLLTDHRLLPKCPLATKVLARPLRNCRNPSPGPKAETNDSATAPRALNALGTPTVATAPITIRLARGHRSIPCNTVRSSQCCAGRASRGVAPVAQSTSTLWLKCRCDGLRRRTHAWPGGRNGVPRSPTRQDGSVGMRTESARLARRPKRGGQPTTLQ